MKKGALRFYPYNINWNYGMLPQTWEDPGHKNEEAGGVFVRLLLSRNAVLMPHSYLRPRAHCAVSVLDGVLEGCLLPSVTPPP